MPDDPNGRPESNRRRRRTARSTKATTGSVTPPRPGADEAEATLAAPVAGAADDPGAAGRAGSASETFESPGLAKSPLPAESSGLAGSAGPAESPDPVDPAIWPLLDSRSPNEWVCPFLRSVDDRDMLAVPVESPDVANRCASLDDAVPQSLRQQELVCLTTAHVNCPRYLRGAVVPPEPAVADRRAPAPITPAMLGALALLAFAFVASVAFAFAHGGLDLPAAAAYTGAPGTSPSAVAVIPTGIPSTIPSIGISPAPSVEPSASQPSSPAPGATDTPQPTPSPTASGSASPTPSPSSDRYALLTACPGKPSCWVYQVRSGDNLYSIANYFGVPLATVKALNPWTRSGLKVGHDLILPPPTR